MRRAAWFLTIAILFWGTPAMAQADARSRALELNGQAQSLFEAGDYEKAATTFAEAYAVFEEPRILLGETIAWYKAGDCEKALPKAARFMREADGGSETDRANVSKIQAECAVIAGQEKLAAGDLAGAEVELRLAERLDLYQGASRSIAELETGLEGARTAEPAPEPELVVEPEPASSADGRGRSPLVGGSLIALGAAAIATGAVLTVSYSNAVSDYEDDRGACESGYDDPRCGLSQSELLAQKSELDDRRKRTALPRTLLFAGGAALVGTGVVLLALPRRDGASEVAFLLSPTGGAMRVRF